MTPPATTGSAEAGPADLAVQRSRSDGALDTVITFSAGANPARARPLRYVGQSLAAAARAGCAPDTSEAATLMPMTTAAPSAVLGRDVPPIKALSPRRLPNIAPPFRARTRLPAELPDCNGVLDDLNHPHSVLLR